jgi:DNA-binding transcriptional regulator YdaS (Cro superfamily)
MKLSVIVAHFGVSQNETARLLGFEPSYFAQCNRKSEIVPVHVALIADAISGGELKFDKWVYQQHFLAKQEAKS